MDEDEILEQMDEDFFEEADENHWEDWEKIGRDEKEAWKVKSPLRRNVSVEPSDHHYEKDYRKRNYGLTDLELEKTGINMKKKELEHELDQIKAEKAKIRINCEDRIKKAKEAYEEIKEQEDLSYTESKKFEDPIETLEWMEPDPDAPDWNSNDGWLLAQSPEEDGRIPELNESQSELEDKIKELNRHIYVE